MGRTALTSDERREARTAAAALLKVLLICLL